MGEKIISKNKERSEDTNKSLIKDKQGLKYVMKGCRQRPREINENEAK